MYFIDHKIKVTRVMGYRLPRIVLRTLCSNQYSGHPGVMEVCYVLWSPFKKPFRHWVL
jgi:hypothetical protein